jgi:hypothetical protein
LIEQTEHGRVDADAQAQGEDDGRREAGRSFEAAPRIGSILAKPIEPGEQRHGADLFFIVGGVAQESPRRELSVERAQGVARS